MAQPRGIRLGSARGGYPDQSDERQELKAGAYVVIPGVLEHVREVPSDSEATILVRRAGPADFYFVE